MPLELHTNSMPWFVWVRGDFRPTPDSGSVVSAAGSVRSTEDPAGAARGEVRLPWYQRLRHGSGR